MNRMKMAKGERHSAAPTLHHLEVRKAENGGHIISHHFDVTGGGEYHPPDDHIFASEEGQKAIDHITDVMEMKINPTEASSEGEESERGAGEHEEEA
jgi:hypothetical protein